MNVYEEIDQETMMLLLDSLCKRTVEGKQIWENMEYNPISFLQKDIYEKEGTCISQMFEATTVFNNIEYKLELSESIELPSGKGDIFGTISYETKDGEENTYDFSLSFDVEKYDDANAEELQGIFGNSIIVQFIDAIVGVFENSDAVAEGFAYARYFHQTGIDPEWETNPLVKLGEKLMQEHAMLGFHKIVLDTDYRKSLLKRS